MIRIREDGGYTFATAQATLNPASSMSYKQKGERNMKGNKGNRNGERVSI